MLNPLRGWSPNVPVRPAVAPREAAPRQAMAGDRLILGAGNWDTGLGALLAPNPEHVAFVTGLYWELLDRAPDPAGLQDHLRRMAGGLGRDAVRQSFLDSWEYRTREANKRFLGELYRELLGREPDPEGFEDFLNRMMRHGLTHEQARLAMLDSAEYKARQAGMRPEAPYINQYDPGGEDADYTGATADGLSQCGPTALAMIARAFGYGDGLSDADLIQDLGARAKTGVQDGTGVYQLAEAAGGLPGLRAEVKGPRAQIDWIAERLRAGELVIANGNYYAMRPHVDWAKVNAGRGGHYVAVTGLDDQGRFLVHDPAYHNGGAAIAYTREEMETFIDANSNGGFQIAVGRE